ncbi:hypothetical protein [Microvirga massiliensis]|uniref:hypothetical protein n=1 Tax=Microvirga massiliensis TaxID=1033741 RepID=UPI00164D6FBB|nr:hypothetical protein [Microvirga massiliensis]
MNNAVSGKFLHNPPSLDELGNVVGWVVTSWRRRLAGGDYLETAPGGLLRNYGVGGTKNTALNPILVLQYLAEREGRDVTATNLAPDKWKNDGSYNL